jgi:OmpA-OmpF porin, OOP family
MKHKQSFYISLALLSLLVAAVAVSHAQSTSHPGYVYSTDGKTPVHDMDGHCVRTMEWRKEYANMECNPELVPAPKVVAPAPAPAPAPAAESTPAPAAAATAAAAAAVVPEKDSDNDGVPDSKDKCPDTPAGVKVDANGCPLDSDNDGVPDYLDKCPDTPAGATVNADGCVIKITLNVQFDSGKAEVKSQYLPELEQFAQALKQKPEVKVEIEGHTDNVGNAAKNKSLSEARAKAVRDVLVKKYGIAADRVTAQGYGMEKPVAGNDTPEGREKNRRVDAVRVK